MTIDVRPLREDDGGRVRAAVDEWWGGRTMSGMLPPLFFSHFHDTGLVVEDERGEMIGFLVGFLSQSRTDEAYVHFIGVHPDHRGRGVGHLLYERFFEIARGHGRSLVRCVTSPVNRGSIAFHTRLGFEAEQGDAELEGIPVWLDYDGPGEHRVRFRRSID